MNEERLQPIVETRIRFGGGGRLEGVARIVDVRLAPGDLRWRLEDPFALRVEGDMRTYIYWMEKEGGEVKGEGFLVPFATTMEARLPFPSDVDVVVRDAKSEHQFDPVTGDFQHQVTLQLQARRPTATPSPSQSGGRSAETATKSVAAGAPTPSRADEKTPIVWKPFPPRLDS